MNSKRKVSPFVVALPAFIVVIIFKFIPFVISIITSFQEYSPKRGIFGSNFVGLQNYNDFFGNYIVQRLLTNTLVLTILPAILTCVIAFIAIVSIAHLANRWSKCLALSVVAIPAIIPTAMLCGIAKDYFSNLLTEPGLYPWIYSLVETLKYMFIPIAVGVVVAKQSNGTVRDCATRVATGYFLVRLSFIATMSKDITIMLYNPMVYATADTLSSYTFRKGLLEAAYGVSGAVNFIRAILQVVFTTFAFFGIKNLMRPRKTLSHTAEQPGPSRSLFAVLGSILASIGGIAIIGKLVYGVVTSGQPLGQVLTDGIVQQALSNSFWYSAFSAILFTVLAVLLAYPLTMRNNAYSLVLFLVFTSSAMLAEYLLVRMMGLIDTGPSVILFSGISVAGALVLHIMTSRHVKQVDSFSPYIGIVAPYVVLIFIIGLISSWGGNSSMIVLQTRSKFPISQLVREVFVQNYMDIEKYMLGIVAALPPLILGWVGIWFGGKLFSGTPSSTDT